MASENHPPINGNPDSSYGHLDTTFKASGGQPGIKKLVESFYTHMEHDARFKTIRDWHPTDLTISKDKLTLFLCGWMGGPRLYQEKYGRISIPAVHAHLAVGEKEKQMWLNCMKIALQEQQYPDSLVVYLLDQLAKPAEMIRTTSKS